MRLETDSREATHDIQRDPILHSRTRFEASTSWVEGHNLCDIVPFWGLSVDSVEYTRSTALSENYSPEGKTTV